ncbi:hypothetical protein BDP27DRAFT_1397733 [Rhodocollybia butyracea]|uniref:RRM domain-containing protein n=1 Tax=Rhodocollybia butyracea TaxID=206335 RepID=A0A9P5UEK0_9AGAR|nr:hypothetical protein BDP27DRAFT_1397733 [Rhodocollybia butyracea]
MSVVRRHAARSVVFKQLPPSLEVKNLLSLVPSGRIHQVKSQSNNSLVINFLDSRSATHFTRKFLASSRDGPLNDDISLDYGESQPIPVEILAAIGLKNASRVIRVTSNNEKDIPSALKGDLNKCGTIESLVDDSRSAVCHFMSIESAIKALELLRSSKTYGGYSVYFGIDRKSHFPRSFPKGSKTDIVLASLPKDATTKEILDRIQLGVPSLSRETVRSIRFRTKTRKAFINFFEPGIAKMIFDSFEKAEGNTRLTRGVSVSWLRCRTPSISTNLRIAVDAGVSRTLTVSNIKDVRQLKSILKDIAEFGTILSNPYNSKTKTVYIEFADIYSSLKAIERIHKDPSAYPAFNKTHISFTSATSSIRPMKVSLPKTPSPTSAKPSAQAASEASSQPTAEIPKATSTDKKLDSTTV